jgi:hypothetical protein
MLSFDSLHIKRALRTGNIGCRDDLVVSPELAHWTWIKQLHILEGAASDQQAGSTGHWTTFRVYRVNLYVKFSLSVLPLQLLLSLVLRFCDWQHNILC